MVPTAHGSEDRDPRLGSDDQLIPKVAAALTFSSLSRVFAPPLTPQIAAAMCNAAQTSAAHSAMINGEQNHAPFTEALHDIRCITSSAHNRA